MKLYLVILLLLVSYFPGVEHASATESLIGVNITIALTNTTVPRINTTPIPDTERIGRISQDFILPPVYFEKVFEKVFFTLPMLPNETLTARVSVLVKRLCGYPIIYDAERCIHLNTSQALSNCEYKGGSAVFGSAICLLSMVILLGNALVIFVFCKTKEMRTKYNFIKASLAIADSLCGLILLGSILPNIIYVRNSTEQELMDDLLDYNSPQYIFFGAMLTLSFQSSLLHLMFLSIDRLIAIKWSLYHRQQRTSTLMMSLCLLWVVSALCSFVPAAFEDVFGFTFQHVLFSPLLTLKPVLDDETGYKGPLYLVIIYGLPYLIMVIASILTGIILHRKLKSRTLNFGGNICSPSATQQSSSSTSGTSDRTTGKAKQNSTLKPEISVFFTLVLMIGAFTITLLPGLLVQLLFFADTQDCFKYSVLYAISFYIAMANSFANVLIYSFRDERFRKAVKDIYNRKRTKQEQTIESSTRNTQV